MEHELQDMKAAATAFADVAVMPPVPPVLQAAFEAVGVAAAVKPRSVFA